MNQTAENSPSPRDRASSRGNPRSGDAQREETQREDPPSEPCHVGIVFALSQESGGLIDRLAGSIDTVAAGFKIREGGLAGRRVAAIVSGSGRKAAARAAEMLIAGHDPQWIISSGFAGGLVESIARGDIVAANEIVAAKDTVTAGNTANATTNDAAVESASHSGDQRIVVDVPAELAALLVADHIGRFVTVDAIVTTPARKRELAEAHGAIAVDMESLAVAEVCRREQRRFLAIRIVSDAVDDELPEEVSNLIKQKSLAAQFGAVAGALFKRPSSIKDLYRLKENALLGSDQLAKFLETVIANLKY
ncbi:MAG: hypothetical protein WD875_08825 [Pirellulales bacterium]